MKPSKRVIISNAFSNVTKDYLQEALSFLEIKNCL